MIRRHSIDSRMHWRLGSFSSRQFMNEWENWVHTLIAAKIDSWGKEKYDPSIQSKNCT